MTLYYWCEKKGRGEEDMVKISRSNLKPSWAVEIKWSDYYFDRPEKLKSLRDFLLKNKLESAVITTISKRGNVESTGLKYRFIPAALHAYGIGKRTFTTE